MKINIAALVRPQVRTLKPYSIPKVSCRIKLDAMENPYDLPGDIKKKIFSDLKKLAFNRYPDSEGSKLRQAIAKYLSVAADRLLLGNGSDELILAILLTFGGLGKRVVYPVPTFSIYGILTQITGGSRREVYLGDGFQLNAKQILRENPDLIFIAYPNNPTGNCFNQREIAEIIEKTKGLVVIDEAYFEFSHKTFLSQLTTYENVIILRTFSKAFGLAGLRVGYLAARPAIIKEISKVKLPYNVNTLSQAIAVIMLKNIRYISGTVDIIKKERILLFEGLKTLVTAYPSETNFIFFQCRQAQALYNYLLGKRILIKSFNEGYLKNYLRVTVGTPAENKEFLKETKKFFRGQNE